MTRQRALPGTVRADSMRQCGLAVLLSFILPLSNINNLGNRVDLLFGRCAVAYFGNGGRDAERNRMEIGSG